MSNKLSKYYYIFIKILGLYYHLLNLLLGKSTNSAHKNFRAQFGKWHNLIIYGK